MVTKATTKLSDEILGVLAKSKIDGCNFYLPPSAARLDRKVYLEVNKILENVGGLWTKAAKCHVFDKDPTEYINNILSTGFFEDYKKKFQFFPTPKSVIDLLIEIADVQPTDIILEPSIGKANIADAISINKYGCWL